MSRGWKRVFKFEMRLGEGESVRESERPNE
jgi:hypothetical protein